MKLAILSRWNSACGVSLHAEIVGREWVKNGHNLILFIPENTRPIGKNGEYVIKHSLKRI